MTTKPQEPAPALFTDPHHEPIRAVDQITFHRSRTAHLDITCCAHVPVAVSQTEFATESVVTARLRMDVAMAKALAEGLMQQIAMIEGALAPMN